MAAGVWQIRLLTASAALALIVATSAWGAGAPALSALIWIAPGHEAAALTRQPAMCSRAAAGDAQVMIGEALFNAPMLLGGQAARADMSCASCHSNGRRNPHFQLDGVSAGPGTADVSSSFFSPARANGRFDPKPIPDLAFPVNVSRDPASGALERFLRGLIVEEFSGREPSPAALSALAAYVRAIGDCGAEQEQPRRLADQIALVRLSVMAAEHLAAAGDPETAAIAVAGARHQLGLINERYAGQGLARERDRLLAASRALQPAAGSRAPELAELRRWLTGFERNLMPMLARSEVRSLYDDARAGLWVSRNRPE
ncbi:hypothetical protein [Novosphingobium sp.]|uniref:hypothetical protein n=1 Tax=Novosphingobium sp. TaxID=1874826 RepID=UPI003BA855C7